MSTAPVGKNQRSSSICLSGSQTFDAMKASVGGNNRESSSGSDSPEVRREVITNNHIGRSGPVGSKSRQSARRSKSERLQGANKPRVKRRDLLDLDRANSGSLAGGLAGNKEHEDAYQSFLRKVPSVGAGLMNDSSFNETPDGSPRGLRSIRQSASTAKPPLGAGSNAPAISTPDLSPSLIRRATVNQRTAGGGGSRSQLANRNSPQVGRPGCNSTKDQPLNKRATSVRVHGASSSSSAFHVANSSLRRSTFLDVPDSPGNDDDNAASNVDEDSYRLRSFDLTRKGVVNRGDSFRRRRSRSNSLAPGTVQHDSTGDVTKNYRAAPGNGSSGGASTGENVQAIGTDQRSSHQQQHHHQHHSDVRTYRVAIIGSHGVGKSAMVGQFMSSDCINAYDRIRNDDTDPESVFVMLNGEESELVFTYCSNIKVEMNRNELPDAFVMMYSVIDKNSFKTTEDELARLQNWDALRSRAIIVVGNKIDLVRSRAVSTQDGKCLACAYRAKFMEVSVVINHNVDELLVGILTQIRLKEELQKEIAEGLVDPSTVDGANGQGSSNSWIRNKGLVRASMKAKQMFTWLFGKDDDQLANCENFQVL
uniref:Ras-related protein Rab-44 n=1 Tax=Daphnia magna TaxID=35525 RepID=A0A0P6DKV1_9CRUS